jgi:RHS repeat-associated protein
LTQITQGTSNVVLGYDIASRRTAATLPNGVTVSYAYDNDSRLSSLSYQGPTVPLGNVTYTYDQNGRLTTVGGSFARTDLPAAVSSASYDAANRLTAWGTNSSFAYDANGNLQGDGTNIYNWDARNQLSSITGGVTASFQYDPLGRRIGKTINGVTTGFLYDCTNGVQELSGGVPSANLLTGGVDEIFNRKDTSSRSFLSDGQGSTSALTDSTGAIATQYTYEPFGNTSMAGVVSSNSFQYTGRENDGTGLYFYRARYYNPVLQRFISQDPIGFGGGDTNLYAYTGNNPVNFTDPSGNVLGVDDALEGLAVCLATPACATLLAGTMAYLSWLVTRGSAPPLSVPISTPADPNGRNSHTNPKKDPCEWPDNPQDMNDLLGQDGTPVPDLPNTPGRNKVIWNLAKGVQLRFENHGYFPPGVDPGEYANHWQIKVPGQPKGNKKYFPGDKIPGCKDGKFF